MRLTIGILLLVTIIATVHAARLPRDDKAATDLINNGTEAETRSKISDISKSVSGTVTKYYNNSKQAIENQLKDLRKVSNDSFNKLSQSLSKTYDTVRSSITGSQKKPETPKIENPISALGN